MSSDPTDAIFAFGPFTLDEGDRLLRRGVDEVPLTAKALDVLLLLVRNPGRTIAKEEFMAQVWPDAVVEEANLTDNISTLRQVLGDDAREPRYIRTVPRRGYRFIAGVTTGGAGADSSDAPRATDIDRRSAPATQPSKRNRGLLALVISLAALALVVSAIVWQRSHSGDAVVQTIAVLPFRPLVAEQSDPALELGMTDALIARLSAIRQVRVRPTAAVLKYRDADLDVRRVAEEQGAHVILDGRVQKLSSRVRLSIQLIRASDGAILWADRFDESVTDILALQDAISTRAAQALALRLSGEERRAMVRRPTTDVEAYRLYLNGRYLWQQFDLDTLPASINHFQAAVDRDPQFALAWAGMAKSYNQLGQRGDRSRRAHAFEQSRIAAQTALRIDPELAEARVAVAARKIFYEWDWPGAEQELLRARRAQPDDMGVHTLLGYLHLARGDTEAALAELQRTLEIAPTWHVAKEDVLWGLLCARRLDEAASRAKRTIALDPRDASAFITVGHVLILRGRHAEAVPMLEQAMGLPAGREATLAPLAAAYANSGRRPEALKLLEEAMREPTAHQPLLVARIHAGLGDTDEAFRWLEKALAMRSPFLWTAGVSPELEPLRKDPRFLPFVQRVRQIGSKTAD